MILRKQGAAWLVLAAVLVHLPQARCAVPEGALAVVNGEPLWERDFARTLVRTLGVATVDAYVDGVLVEQEAARRGVSVTDEELAARRELEIRLGLLRLFENARMSPEEFRALAAGYGWDEAATRREIEQSVPPRALRIRLLTEKLLRHHIELTEQDVRSYYERTRGERFSAAHIVTNDQATGKAILELIRKGEVAWAEAVVRYSLDRASVPYNGRMRPVPVSSALGHALSKMRPGELRLYHDGQNWHVLQLIRRLPADEAPYEQLKDSLKRELYCRRVEELANSWLADLHARASVVRNLLPDPQAREILGGDTVLFVNGQAVSVLAFGSALMSEFGDRLIGPCIERILIFQEAKRRGIVASEDEVRKRTEAICERLFQERAAEEGMSREEFAARLEEGGIQPAEYKTRLAGELVPPDDVRATLLAEKMAGDEIEVSDQDVQLAYQARYGQRVDVRCIIVDSAAQAQDVRDRALRGASFELLVQTESADPHAWMHMGLVRDVTAGHPYFEHVKGLQVGELSDVFERGGRYYVLKLVARRPSAQAPPLESVRAEMVDEAKRRKLRSRVRAWLEKLKAEAQIEVRSS